MGGTQARCQVEWWPGGGRGIQDLSWMPLRNINPGCLGVSLPLQEKLRLCEALQEYPGVLRLAPHAKVIWKRKHLSSLKGERPLHRMGHPPYHTRCARAVLWTFARLSRIRILPGVCSRCAGYLPAFLPIPPSFSPLPLISRVPPPPNLDRAYGGSHVWQRVWHAQPPGEPPARFSLVFRPSSLRNLRTRVLLVRAPTQSRSQGKMGLQIHLDHPQ